MSNELVPSTPTMSEASFNEDWDRSLILEDPAAATTSQSTSQQAPEDTSKQQNSVAFPGERDENTRVHVQGAMRSDERRTLSELLKLHAEKGTDVTFTQEEALRVGDVLGQWINASSSPYEAEDDFFASRSHDDIGIATKVSSNPPEVRSRGQSESIRRSS